MNKKPKDIKVKKRLKEDGQANEYVLQMRRPRKFPWWILLLLLPLLLLIKCKKDITVTCVEEDSGMAVPNIPVDMAYTSHFLWDKGTFFYNEDIMRTQNTDKDGKTTFKDLPCSVFSYIFYILSDITFDTRNECVAAIGERRNFHLSRNVTLNMTTRYENLHIKLIDEEKGFPLPEGSITYKYKDNGKDRQESVKADVNGIVTIPHIRYCSEVDVMQGCCYGYEDKQWTKVNVREIVDNNPAEMPLKPIYQTLDFHTIDDCQVLLPGCSLDITGSVSGKLTPPESGDGNFNVTIRMAENLSIVASKLGFHKNDNTVKDLNYKELQEPSRRVIPLKVKAEPCGGSWVEDAMTDNGYLLRTYHLGNSPGTVNIDYEFMDQPDSITIYDGSCRTQENMIYCRELNGSGTITLNYTQETITLIMKKFEYGSVWKFKVNCPEPIK